jgi:hypothetical protein
MVPCSNVMMQYCQILVDRARMHDTKYNIGMTQSNGKSPKFLSEKLSTLKGKKNFCQKGDLVQNFALKRNHNKKSSQIGLDGRLQDYE